MQAGLQWEICARQLVFIEDLRAREKLFLGGFVAYPTWQYD
jgi:hypothetical protein